MNDFLKSFSSPFSEKVKSPIVGPFIVSWCIFNWKVIYITIFISNTSLAPKNKLDYLLEIMNWGICFLAPLGVALLYIFGMPWIERQVLKFTEEQKKKSLELKLKIAEKYVVDGTKYYKLKEAYDKQIKKLEEYENKLNEQEEEKNSIYADNSSLRIQIESNSNTIKILDSRVANYTQRHDVKRLLTGRWISYVNGVLTDDINFTDNKYFIIDKSGKATHVFDLVGVDIDIERGRITFTKFSPTENIPKCYNDLNIIDNDTLEGTENSNLRIRYEKRKIN